MWHCFSSLKSKTENLSDSPEGTTKQPQKRHQRRGACSVFASSRPRLQRARHVLGAWDRGVVLRVLTPSYTRESLVQQIQVFTEP